MPRRMRNAEFRNHQWEHRYDDHIVQINNFVDELNKKPEDRKAPYVAPLYGGVNARLLSVLSDPGPKAKDSGFLCVENDDATAEAMCILLDEAGIGLSDMVPWNAYPWYINHKPNAAQLNAGVEPLMHIIDLLPMLQVVILHGCIAHASWEKLTRRRNIADGRGLQIIKTYHTSRRAFWLKKEHIRDSLSRAANILGTDINTEPSAASLIFKDSCKEESTMAGEYRDGCAAQIILDIIKRETLEKASTMGNLLDKVKEEEDAGAFVRTPIRRGRARERLITMMRDYLKCGYVERHGDFYKAV